MRQRGRGKELGRESERARQGRAERTSSFLLRDVRYEDRDREVGDQADLRTRKRVNKAISLEAFAAA